MKLKVCGMKYKDNILEVAALHPDYLGFIFYEKSKRFFDGIIPSLPNSIKKVGVFVDSEIEFVLSMIKQHKLDAVQLHGKESPQYCRDLKSLDLEIIKVFNIKNDFDFSVLKAYEDACDFFLFDTKGRLPGGNGYTFNWNVLNNYPSEKPFFLSGGIGLLEVQKLQEFKTSKAFKYCYAVDVNSKFEVEAGLKNKIELEIFKHELQH